MNKKPKEKMRVETKKTYREYIGLTFHWLGFSFACFLVLSGLYGQITLYQGEPLFMYIVPSFFLYHVPAIYIGTGLGYLIRRVLVGPINFLPFHSFFDHEWKVNWKKESYLGVSSINLCLSVLWFYFQGYKLYTGVNFIAQLSGHVLATFLPVTISSLVLPFIAYCIYWALGRDTNKTVIFYLFTISSLIWWVGLTYGRLYFFLTS